MLAPLQKIPKYITLVPLQCSTTPALPRNSPKQNLDKYINVETYFAHNIKNF